MKYEGLSDKSNMETTILQISGIIHRIAFKYFVNFDHRINSYSRS